MLWFVLLPALVVLPAGGAWVYLDAWPREMSQRWEARLADCPDTEIAAHFKRLESFGAAGVQARVRLLMSPRRAVAEAARSSLAEYLQSLIAGDAPIPDVDLAPLADGMEQLVGLTQFGVPESAVDWTWQVLETTGGLSLEARLPTQTRGRLLIACNTLLERPTTTATDARTIARPVPSATSPPAAGTAISTIAAGIPASSPIISNTPQPAMNPAPTASAAVSQAPEPSQAASAANSAARVNPMRGPVTDAHVQPVSNPPRMPTITPEPTPELTAEPALALSARTAWSLFAELGAVDTVSGGALRAELHRRGFSEAEIELGRHLTSPDAAERLHYTQRLPTLAGASLKPWLLHLSADPDVDVRQACLAMMATTHDPAILARVRELAFTDGDEIIRKTAAQVIDGANGKRR
ncbi:MAG: hypothetical protein C0483_19200 [Pirellula sp.]|nr:hypothetical protein [Pirellula sp.]